MRLVRVPDAHRRDAGHYPDGSQVATALADGHYTVTIRRCVACCEGNQVNPVKEAAAIRRYLEARLP
jgi:hypothetical protein